MPLTDHPRIAIAGAGLLGRLLAWRLLRLGHRVTLFEAGSFDQPVSAAHTAAAMISPMSEVVVSERAIYDMGLQSLQLWPQWLQELDQDIDQLVHYSAEGSLVVAHPHDLAELEQFYADLNYHLGADHNATWLDGVELRRMEPDLAPHFSDGIFLPGEAHLDNRRLLPVLLSAVRQLGGECLEQHPLRLDAEQIRDMSRDYDLCIDCRGLGARSAEQPLRGVRGEVLWVQTDEIHLQRPVRLMHPRYKLYVVPKPDNRFIIGATEIESEDRSPVTVQSMLELCSALYTINPAFAEARIVELDSNLRPAFLDNMPRIQWHGRPDESELPLLQINGLHRHGYLLAPTLVEQALNQLVPNQHARPQAAGGKS